MNPAAEDFPQKDLGDGTTIPDYSKLGTINATFKKTDNLEIDTYIKPLSNHIVTYPVKGEIVNITKHEDKYYYWLPLNLNQDINMNKNTGERGDGTIAFQKTKFNRRVLPEQGDTIVQGRFGNSIKLGSDSLYETPVIKITNGQSQTYENIRIKKASSKFPHYEDLNNDGSSIYMTAGPDEQNIKTSADTNNIPDKLFGNQIIVNSDRLIFNAKGMPDFKTGSIHMFAANQINLSATGGVVIEAGKNGMIALGTDADSEQNPIVKGRELKELLIDLIDAVRFFANPLSKKKIEGTNITPILRSSAEDMMEELDGIKKDLSKILSKTNFTI
jgi:hypothetical protein